jgi:hypothetical protein
VHHTKRLAAGHQEKMSSLSNDVILLLDNTQHRRLRTCYRISVQKCWTILHTVQIWHLSIFIYFPTWMGTYDDIIPPLMKTLSLLLSHSVLCSLDGQTYHMLWQVPQLCWKIVYQWHLYHVLSVSSLKTLPVPYGYCNFTFWSFLVVR